MLQVSTNNLNFEIEKQQNGLTLNGQPFGWDMIRLSKNRFHIIKDNRSYNAELVEADYGQKTFKIKINNAVYELKAKDKFDILLEKMGMNASTKAKINNIKAPMPGLIWEVKVSVGDVVKAGDVVLVLVAMKMENALKTSGEGVVKAIKINKGDTVEKGQVLIEFV